MHVWHSRVSRLAFDVAGKLHHDHRGWRNHHLIIFYSSYANEARGKLPHPTSLSLRLSASTQTPRTHTRTAMEPFRASCGRKCTFPKASALTQCKVSSNWEREERRGLKTLRLLLVHHAQHDTARGGTSAWCTRSKQTIRTTRVKILTLDR